MLKMFFFFSSFPLFLRERISNPIFLYQGVAFVFQLSKSQRCTPVLSTMYALDANSSSWLPYLDVTKFSGKPKWVERTRYQVEDVVRPVRRTTVPLRLILSPLRTSRSFLEGV